MEPVHVPHRTCTASDEGAGHQARLGSPLDEGVGVRKARRARKGPLLTTQDRFQTRHPRRKFPSAWPLVPFRRARLIYTNELLAARVMPTAERRKRAAAAQADGLRMPPGGSSPAGFANWDGAAGVWRNDEGETPESKKERKARAERERRLRQKNALQENTEQNAACDNEIEDDDGTAFVPRNTLQCHWQSARLYRLPTRMDTRLELSGRLELSARLGLSYQRPEWEPRLELSGRLELSAGLGLSHQRPTRVERSRRRRDSRRARSTCADSN